MKSLSKIFVLFLLISCFHHLFSSFKTNSNYEIISESNNSHIIDSSSLLNAYTPHPQIEILNNSHFHQQAIINNWDQGGTRNGTKNFPYIINELSITGNGTESFPLYSNFLIVIENTDVFFRIINCTFTNSRLALGFRNVTNAYVSQNSITNCYWGIGISGEIGTIDYSIIIFNNTFKNNSISISLSQLGNHVRIVKNSFIENKVGISGKTEYLEIINNSFSTISSGAIRLESSDSLKIINNTITNASSGISLSYSSFNTIISNNTIINATSGLRFHASYNNTIKYNYFTNCGFSLWGD